MTAPDYRKLIRERLADAMYEAMLKVHNEGDALAGCNFEFAADAAMAVVEPLILQLSKPGGCYQCQHLSNYGSLCGDCQALARAAGIEQETP